MKKTFLIILLIAQILIVAGIYSKSVTNELSDDLLRMHIIANSDSSHDQKIKLEVRDKIICDINKEMKSKNEVVENVVNIEKELNSFLEKNNIEYNCKVFVDNSDFDTKEYNNISIPAGKYEALKVVLGKGKGKNWWCVAYPPLCFTESVLGNISASGEKELKERLDTEAYNIILNNNMEYKVKFKIIEIINSLF